MFCFKVIHFLTHTILAHVLYIVKDVESLPWIRPVIQSNEHLIHPAVLLFSACCSLSPCLRVASHPSRRPFIFCLLLALPMSPRGISSIPSSFYFLPVARSPPCLRVDPSTDLGLQGPVLQAAATTTSVRSHANLRSYCFAGDCCGFRGPSFLTIAAVSEVRVSWYKGLLSNFGVEMLLVKIRVSESTKTASKRPSSKRWQYSQIGVGELD